MMNAVSKVQLVNAAVACHKGCVRNNNEDNFLFNGDRMKLEEMDAGALIGRRFEDGCQLYAVVDGMGGGDLGERASAIAAGMLVGVLADMARLDPAQCLTQAAYQINRAVRDDCREHGADYEGTTMTALALRDGTAHICNVGDSRVYRLRGDALEQLTEDHSVVWEEYRAGRMTMEQARKSPSNNMITRFLGMEDADMPEPFAALRQETLQPGDRFMLCSDGVSDLLSFRTIAEVMQREKDPLPCAVALIQMALEEGGKDNATCIVADVIKVTEGGSAAPKAPAAQTTTTTISL